METVFDNIEHARTDVRREKAKEDFRALMRDTKGLLRATAEDVSDKAKETCSHLNETLDQAKASCQLMGEQTIAAAKAADKAVRKHPYVSIGAAFGIGIIIGALLARK